MQGHAVAIDWTPLRPAGLHVFFRRLRRDKLGTGAVILCVLITLIAVLAPWLAPWDPYLVNTEHRLSPPSSEHLFGTDELGRDIFSRMVYGARVSLQVAFIAMTLSVLIGVAAGLISGYSIPVLDQTIMRVTDIFLAFPPLILAMAFSAALGPSVNNAALALGLVWWPGYARLMRGQVLIVKRLDYVEASRAIGVGTVRILLKHILPNAMDPVKARMTMTAGNAILFSATLSFIGLGAQPPTPEWGLTVALARKFLMTDWWYPTVAGLVIFVAVLAFTIASDAIQDLLDPRLHVS